MHLKTKTGLKVKIGANINTELKPYFQKALDDLSNVNKTECTKLPFQLKLVHISNVKTEKKHIVRQTCSHFELHAINSLKI